MTRARRVWRWLAVRPFRSSLLVRLCVAVPGFLRVEGLANEAQRTADQVAQIQEQAEAERVERAEQACARSVAVRDDNRAMWLFVLNLLAGGELVPTVAEALDELLPQLECGPDNVAVPID